jgi:hypothetical protein
LVYGEANARLAQAAPDLMAACESALSNLRRWRDSDDPNRRAAYDALMDADMANAWDALKAAISKARGHQP